MNAGPRQRFTVLGETGAVIVHNCAENITQAVAGSILRETLVYLDGFKHSAPIETVAHTHDEVVLEVEDRPATIAHASEHLEYAMGRWRPEWRADLPLTAEVTAYEYYTKAIG